MGHDDLVPANACPKGKDLVAALAVGRVCERAELGKGVRIKRRVPVRFIEDGCIIWDHPASVESGDCYALHSSVLLVKVGIQGRRCKTWVHWGLLVFQAGRAPLSPLSGFSKAMQQYPLLTAARVSAGRGGAQSFCLEHASPPTVFLPASIPEFIMSQ